MSRFETHNRVPFGVAWSLSSMTLDEVGRHGQRKVVRELRKWGAEATHIETRRMDADPLGGVEGVKVIARQPRVNQERIGL